VTSSIAITLYPDLKLLRPVFLFPDQMYADSADLFDFPRFPRFAWAGARAGADNPFLGISF
jgi:hypothetical protein